MGEESSKKKQPETRRGLETHGVLLATSPNWKKIKTGTFPPVDPSGPPVVHTYPSLNGSDLSRTPPSQFASL